MSDLKAMLGKPPKGQDEDKKMAKMKALTDLKSHMSKSMGKGLMDGMEAKKVSVIAPDQEGLEKGLDKAKEVVAGDTGMSEMMEDSSEETAEQEVSEAIEKVTDPSEIDALMRMLEEKKKALETKV